MTDYGCIPTHYISLTKTSSVVRTETTGKGLKSMTLKADSGSKIKVQCTGRQTKPKGARLRQSQKTEKQVAHARDLNTGENAGMLASESKDELAQR